MTDENRTINISYRSARKGLALLFFALVLLILNQLFVISIQPRFRLQPKGDGAQTESNLPSIDTNSLEQLVLPQSGVELPINWGDFGRQLIKDGVIDEQKFRAIFSTQFNPPEEKAFKGEVSETIVMNLENSRFWLDMLWAFGLANQNEILDEGEMMDPQYGGAGNFASTGGWTLSQGNAMSHYSTHSYLALTPEQQSLVDKVSKLIFRPCCGNSTHFPDCNHGMAMLALLQLMAANNISEEQMFKTALQVNAYWFPQTYMDLAVYFKEQGSDWDQINPKIILSAEYSSAQGYQNTRQKIQSLPEIQSGGGGCGA